MSNIVIKQEHEKEIVALTIFESVRLRPGMYVGSPTPIEDRIPLIIDNKIKMVDKTWSPGFMHLFIEIFDNALDEAKRCKGKMPFINIKLNLDDNSVTIRDTGGGFYNASKLNKKTGKSSVRTAFEELHAGSNFSATEKNIVGTHGVGAAVCNILSSKFLVKTVNDHEVVTYEWNNYELISDNIKKRKNEELGTEVTFIPSKEVYGNQKWDLDIIKSFLSFKKFLVKYDPVISNLQFNVEIYKANSKINLDLYEDFLNDCIKVETKLGSIFLWASFDNSASVSFINGANCQGIHQKIINDWCNEYFNYNLAHHYYETLIFLNVNNKLLRFADQNKFKYAITRAEIEEELNKNFKKRLISLLNKSEIAQKVKEDIDNKRYNESLNKIKRDKKTSNKKKISEKYIAPSKHKLHLYISEGNSAQGSLLQARNSESEGVYALRGKIKNVKSLSDFAENREIMDIVSILNLDPNNKSKNTDFDKIIIATDADSDGGHISALIINFFYNWFPQIIKSHKLFILATPLVSCKVAGQPKYFYSLEDFNEFINKNKVTNINYLKGLGSLSVEDWKFVMNNKMLFKITDDSHSSKLLDIAFGENSQKKRKWLENK